MITETFYEVHSKRAIHEPIDDMVVMDRDWNKKKAIKSARSWGGCVVRVVAEVTTRNPMVRRVISSELIWVHKPRKTPNPKRDQLTHRKLMGKLRQNSKSLYRGYRR